MHFREEPVTPVYRHWMCEQCGHEDWAEATYPRIAYLPIEAIGPDDSYT
jgi:hypothetical protein